MARAALDGVVIRRRSGPVVPGARVYIYERGTTDQVDVYQTDTDGGDTKFTQPLLTNADGTLPGFVEPGRYDAKASGDPDTTHIEAGVVGSVILTGSALGRLAGDFPDPHFSDAAMEALADLTPAADKLAYFTGPTGAALTTLTSFWRGVLDDPDGDTTRQTLGLDHVERPEYHGAVGDGTTDDYAALAAAIATGKNVWLTPGKTYLVRRPLSMSNDNQVIHGNGATITRQAQASTTTTTTITSGSTNSIVVASAAGLSVGDYIVVENGSTYDMTARQISGISGTTVTISGTFGISASGTTNVHTAFYGIRVTGDNCKILDLTLDGNSANWSWSRWAVIGGVFLDACINPVVSRCYLKNQVGDAVVTNDCTNATIAFNNIDSCTGRGISLGGSGSDIGSKVLYNRLYNCETDANAYLTGSGGNDAHGSINFSLGGKDCLIQGNYIDTGITGIGGLGHAYQSGAKVIGNTVRNMSTLGLDANMKSNSSPALNVTIADNKFYDSVAVSLIASAAATAFPTGWNIHDNLFSETQLNVTCAQDSKITDNTCLSTGTSLTLINLSGGGAGSAALKNLIVKGNFCRGGSRGINCTDTPGAQAVTIVENHCVNQNLGGIRMLGISIRALNNFVASGAASSTSNYDGISLAGPLEASGNKVDLSEGTNGHGITINAGSNAICRRNVVKLGSNTAGATPFFNNTSALNTRFEYNEWDANNIANSGTNIIKRGNRGSNVAGTGVATLVGGTVTVSTGEVRTGDNVILSRKTIGGTPGNLSLGTITDATSFVINSDSATDTSTVFWEIVH